MSKQRATLFRENIVEKNTTKVLGRVVLIRPVSFRIISAVAFLIGAIVGGFIYFGSFQAKVSALGEIVPRDGVIYIVSQQSGQINSIDCIEGDEVKLGEPLISIISQRFTANGKDAEKEQLAQINNKHEQFDLVLNSLNGSERGQSSALVQRIKLLKAELERVDAQLEDQVSRLDILNENLVRFNQMERESLITRVALDEKRQEVLDQKTRVAATQRERIAILREIAQANGDLLELPNRIFQQRSEIERAKSGLVQERTESQLRNGSQILAPANGVIASIHVRNAQSVVNGTALISMVPKSANYKANLYVRSEAIGAVRVGQKVRLRVKAFPFQKFGFVVGVVESISKAPVDISATGVMQNMLSRVEDQHFRVVINIINDGKNSRISLLPGMMVDADIFQDRRYIYEWILFPLINITTSTTSYFSL